MDYYPKREVSNRLSPPFRWRDGLSLDVPAIDKDHRQLIDLLNRLRLPAHTAEHRESGGPTRAIPSTRRRC